MEAMSIWPKELRTPLKSADQSPQFPLIDTASAAKLLDPILAFRHTQKSVSAVQRSLVNITTAERLIHSSS